MILKISSAHPKFPAKHSDLALGQFFAQPPLNGVQTVISGKGDVPAADGGTH